MFASRHAEAAWKLEIYGTEGSLVMTDDQQVKVGFGDEPFTAIELQGIQRPEDLSDRGNAFFFNQLSDGL